MAIAGSDHGTLKAGVGEKIGGAVAVDGAVIGSATTTPDEIIDRMGLCHIGQAVAVIEPVVGKGKGEICGIVGIVVLPLIDRPDAAHHVPVPPHRPEDAADLDDPQDLLPLVPGIYGEVPVSRILLSGQVVVVNNGKIRRPGQRVSQGHRVPQSGIGIQRCQCQQVKGLTEPEVHHVPDFVGELEVNSQVGVQRRIERIGGGTAVRLNPVRTVAEQPGQLVNIAAGVLRGPSGDHHRQVEVEIGPGLIGHHDLVFPGGAVIRSHGGIVLSGIGGIGIERPFAVGLIEVAGESPVTPETLHVGIVEIDPQRGEFTVGGAEMIVKDGAGGVRLGAAGNFRPDELQVGDAVMTGWGLTVTVRVAHNEIRSVPVTGLGHERAAGAVGCRIVTDLQGGTLLIAVEKIDISGAVEREGDGAGHERIEVKAGVGGLLIEVRRIVERPAIGIQRHRTVTTLQPAVSRAFDQIRKGVAPVPHVVPLLHRRVDDLLGGAPAGPEEPQERCSRELSVLHLQVIPLTHHQIRRAAAGGGSIPGVDEESPDAAPLRPDEEANTIIGHGLEGVALGEGGDNLAGVPGREVVVREGSITGIVGAPHRQESPPVEIKTDFAPGEQRRAAEFPIGEIFPLEPSCGVATSHLGIQRGGTGEETEEGEQEKPECVPLFGHEHVTFRRRVNAALVRSCRTSCPCMQLSIS